MVQTYSITQTLQVTVKMGHNVLCFKKKGEAGWFYLSHLAAQHSQTLKFLHCCHLWALQKFKTTCRFNTWNQEIYMLYSFAVMILTLLDLLYFAQSIDLALWNPATFPTRAEADLFESGKMFLTISHPTAVMFSIPSSATETRVFEEVNSKDRERKWKGSGKYWYVGEKLEVSGRRWRDHKGRKHSTLLGPRAIRDEAEASY